MKPTRDKLALLFLLTAATVVTAQDRPRDPAPADDREPAQAETRRGTVPAPTPERPDAGPPRDPRLPPDGGSLYQRQMAAQPVAPGGELAAASYFAVPEPEPRLFQKHDLVTIIVRESSKAESEAEKETAKAARLVADLEQFFRLTVDPVGLENAVGDPARIDLAAAGDWEGEGEYEREDNFVARLTGEVIAVKPNGNLVIAARKHIVTDDEEQVFLLTGTCRAEDVTADNAVLSTQLHDLDLRKFTGGDIARAVEKGLIPKLYDAINPF